MKATITFTSVITIEGNNLAEIKEKFETTYPYESAENELKVVDVDYIHDVDTKRCLDYEWADLND